MINGTKHFISHADIADFAIVFVATGSEETRAGAEAADHLLPGRPRHAGLRDPAGLRSVSHRGYHNCILDFDGCRVPAAQILGEEGSGFELMNTWLYATRLTVAAISVGRARRVFDLAAEWAASRKQFGQPIGQFQGTSFKLADMATEIDAADLLTLNGAWLLDQGLDANRMIAQAKLFATEMLARVTDQAIQIFGGMGLMEETADRALLARRPGRADLGRHQRDPAPHHQPRHPAGSSGPELGPAPPAPAALDRRVRRLAGRGRGPPLRRDGLRRADLAGAPEPEAGGAIRSVAELPEPPDAAFVAVNREATVGIVRELAAMGAGGAVCYAAGFRGGRRPGRRAAGGAGRGGGRHADPRPQLLRRHQLSRRGAALARPAWRPALRARRRDPHPVRQHRPQPDHAAARPADRPSDDARQPGHASGCRTASPPWSTTRA